MVNCGAQCEECGKWFTWHGMWRHMPPCPRCNHRPDQKELEDLDARLAASRLKRAHNGVSAK